MLHAHDPRAEEVEMARASQPHQIGELRQEVRDPISKLASERGGRHLRLTSGFCVHVHTGVSTLTRVHVHSHVNKTNNNRKTNSFLKCLPQKPGDCIQIPQHSDTLVQNTEADRARELTSQPSQNGELSAQCKRQGGRKQRKTSQHWPQASEGEA